MKKMFTAMLLTLLAVPAGFASAAQDLEAYGVDTVAGYTALLSTTPTSVGREVEFHVIKPSGSELYIPSETDLSGVARTDLYGYHTRTAGDYRVSVRDIDGGEFDTYHSFEVFPGNLSDDHSSLSASEATVDATGLKKSYITVSLKDEYQNPLSSRNVNLISSRNEDKIERISESATTDENGEIIFAVSSATPGVSSLTAVEASTGMVLSERAKVIFVEPLSDAGGDAIAGSRLTASFIGTASAQEELSGSIARFEIVDLPKTLTVNETATFVVRAADADNNTVKNYTGTVFFDTTDDEATIPQRYEFIPEDLGEHEFELAIRFQTVGTQTFTVTDWNDETISGSATVTVTEKDAGADGELVISKPIEGTYRSSEIEIVGSGPELVDVDLYDGKLKLGTVGTTSDGEYSYTVKNLADGEHIFQSKTSDGQLESNRVRIVVDNSGAQIISVRIEPKDPLVVNTPFTLIVESDPNLAEVRAVMERAVYTLKESIEEPGIYTVAMVAPAVADEYPIDIALTDDLDNTTEEKDAYTLRVIDDATLAIFGVRAEAGNQKVDVSWSPVEGAESYRVDYGIEPGIYTEVAYTDGPVVAKTIENLINGRKYFFVVTALDEDGENYTEKSEEVSATPFAPAPVLNLTAEPGDGEAYLGWTAYEDAASYLVSFGTDSGNYVESFDTKSPVAEATAYNLVNGTTYYFTVTALDEEGENLSSPSNEAFATPYKPIVCKPTEVMGLKGKDAKQNGHVNLEWTPSEGTNRYAIFMGDSEETLEFLTEVKDTTTWEGDFEEGTYYFAVRSICDDAHEAPADFDHPIKVDVGPEFIIIVFISMLFFAAAYKLYLVPRKVAVTQTRKEIDEILK